MSKYKWLFIVGLVLLAVAGLSVAQTTMTEDYNWCDAGEKWGDGRCDDNDEL